MDPIELRRPQRTREGSRQRHAVLQPPSARGVRDGRRAIRLDARPAAPRSQRDGDWLVGQGVATGELSRISHADGGTRAHQRRRHAPSFRRRARRWAWARPPCRRSTPPSALGLPLEKVRFEYGDSQPARCAGMAGGSCQTVSVGAAVHAGRRQGCIASCSRWRSTRDDSPLARPSIRGGATPRRRHVSQGRSGDAARPIADILQRAGQDVRRGAKSRPARRSESR